eukprot:scaffold41630_cov19-Tisochrysis_lutea.AAC.2
MLAELKAGDYSAQCTSWAAHLSQSIQGCLQGTSLRVFRDACSAPLSEHSGMPAAHLSQNDRRCERHVQGWWQCMMEHDEGESTYMHTKTLAPRNLEAFSKWAANTK